MRGSEGAVWREEGGIRGILSRAEVDLSQAIPAPCPETSVMNHVAAQTLALPQEGSIPLNHAPVNSVPAEEVEDERGIWFPIDLYRLVEAKLKMYKRNVLSLKHGNSLVPIRALLSFRYISCYLF